MRLAQLSRKFSVRPAEIVDLLARHNITVEPSANAKVEGEALTIVIAHYAPHIHEEGTREPEVVASEPPLELSETPEPGADGTLLDNTLIVWTNELGKGNSHTLNDIPFVLVGGGLDFRMGRSLKFGREAHNRLLLSLAHGFGHRIERFGNPDYCGSGPLNLA